MRPISLVLVFAACGGSGDGAVLSFTAPDGPGSVSRIEIVLASADAGARTEARQRMQPGKLMEVDVVYYRQRSSVDAIRDVGTLDGFELRIEPDEAVVDDDTFLPFALIYDEHDALIAVGSVNDESGVPTSVIVKPGMLASYDVTVIKLIAAADDAAITAGQGLTVSCGSMADAWPSGVAWKPASGPQIRLLLPDISEDTDATDAMLRDTDLDCDTHPADERDCDDLRTTYHPGKTELCDGDDTDCDGRRFELVEGCATPNPSTCSAPGVQLCVEGPSDVAAGMEGTCMASAACGCAYVAGGALPPNCRHCRLDFDLEPNGAAPCAPSVAKIYPQMGCESPGCSVDVVGADGPWEFKVATAEAGPYTTRVASLPSNYFYLRAQYLGTGTFPINSPTIGGGYFSITPTQGQPFLLPLNLELSDVVTQSQCVANSLGHHLMRCY